MPRDRQISEAKKPRKTRRSNIAIDLPTVDVNILRDNITRYSGAVKEYVVGYSGIDYETGRTVSRSLKKISGYKINELDSDRNLSQHAGFSAETMEVTDRRAQQCIHGKRPTVQRVDDLPGHVNDELYDVTTRIDRNGNPIPGHSEQFKFISAGKNTPPSKVPERLVGKLLSKQYKKYRDNPGKIVVPKEEFDGIKAELSSRQKRLAKALKEAQISGNRTKEEHVKDQLKEVKVLDSKITRSTRTKAEARFYTEHPELGTAFDVAKTSTVAGWEAAQSGMLIGAGVSLVNNTIALLKGDKDIGEASVAMAKDIAGAGAASFATASISSMAVGLSKNAATSCVRKLANANVAAVVATTAVEASKIIYGLCTGSMSGTDAVERVGNTVIGMAAAYVYGTVGQALVPIPVVGAMIGNLVGTIMTTGFKLAMSAMSDAMNLLIDGGDAAHDRRLEIEKECKRMELYYIHCAAELRKAHEKYLDDNYAYYTDLFTILRDCYLDGDVDGYVKRVNAAVIRLGGSPLYESKREFDRIMVNQNTQMVL